MTSCRQIHRAEPLVPEASAFETWVAVEKLRRHKSTGVNQIATELIKAADRTIRSEIHKFINSI